MERKHVLKHFLDIHAEKLTRMFKQWPRNCPRDVSVCFLWRRLQNCSLFIMYGPWSSSLNFINSITEVKWANILQEAPSPSISWPEVSFHQYFLISYGWGRGDGQEEQGEGTESSEHASTLRPGRLGGLVQLHRGSDRQVPSDQDSKWQMTAQGDNMQWQYLFLQQSGSFSHGCQPGAH